MRISLNHWRFYGLGKDEYKKCMEKVFPRNILSLRRTNGIVIALLASFTCFPLLIDKDSTKAIFFIISSAIAMFLYIFIRYKYRQNAKKKKVSKGLVCTLIFLTYTNVIFFGIYLGVWANPGRIAGSFLGILICALFLFNIPAIFHFCLTVCSMVIFIVIVVIVKSPAEWSIDIPNTLFAGIVGLFFDWHIIMNRLSLVSLASRMRDERNSYYDQSTIDELTQLKNRRDFFKTFQELLTNNRQSDNFLCVAILDIDFFKNYNDHYGHPEGDECLRNIGKALKRLNDYFNIYAARVGGEEFAMIWFEKEVANVKNVASLINTTIRNLNIPHEKSDAAPYITVSIGIYVVQLGTCDNIDTLYNFADKALYNAKKNGRNCAFIKLPDSLHTTSLRKTAHVFFDGSES